MKAEGREFVDYWEKTVPWTFRRERLTYIERRRLRYSLQDYMGEAIPFKGCAGKRILEVGSGSGIDSAEFGKNGAEVVSLDFTETGVRTTRETLCEAGVASFDVVRASAELLPFRDGVFDCVYSFGVIHHIPRVRKVIKGISAALVPRGEFIFMVYNKESLLYAYSILFLHRGAGSEEELVSRYSERFEGCPYTRTYTEKEVASLLGADFDKVSTSVHFNAIDTPHERKVKVGISDEYRLGWHIIVRARKRYRSLTRRRRLD